MTRVTLQQLSSKYQMQMDIFLWRWFWCSHNYNWLLDTIKDDVTSANVEIWEDS